MGDVVFLAIGAGLFAALGGYIAALRRGLTVIIAVIYAAAAAGVAIYMVVALLRPEKF